MAQIARSNEAEKATDNVAAISRRVADKGADAALETTGDAARRGSQSMQRTAGAALEVEHAVSRRSAEGVTEVGQAFAELVKEQARDNAEAFRALAGAFDWGKAARIQADLLRASVERATGFTRRYLEAVQAVTASVVSATKQQARKTG